MRDQGKMLRLMVRWGVALLHIIIFSSEVVGGVSFGSFLGYNWAISSVNEHLFVGLK